MQNILSFKTNGGESVKGTAAEGDTILLIDSVSTAQPSSSRNLVTYQEMGRFFCKDHLTQLGGVLDVSIC